MRLSDYIHQDLVYVNLRAKDRKDLFEQMLDKICVMHELIDKDDCLDLLLEREKQYGTGLEDGAAVPHAMVSGLDKTLVAVATLSDALDFGSQDANPARIVFLLLSPNGFVTQHIRILARIARFCSMPSFLKCMLEAKEASELYQVILKEDQQHV